MFFTVIKSHKKLLLLTLLLLCVGWLMINPVLDMLDVSDHVNVEAFSIPLQQLARVIHNGGYLTEYEQHMLSQILDLEICAADYDPHLADPIKWFAFRRENMEFAREHFVEYVKIWGYIGMRYPEEYIKAWIEQTKGYWNGGYEYWRYASGVLENEFGLQNTVLSPGLANFFDTAFRWFDSIEFLQPLRSIGLHVWILIICTLINLLRRQSAFLLAVPALVILLGLWLGTPVYAEFRYAYPIFMTLPLIVSATFYPPESARCDCR